MLSQADEAKPQQIILGLEMGIECSAADIGLINDVLDRQPIITAFGDERCDGRMESVPGLSDMVVMVGFSGRLIGRFGAKTNLITGLLLMGAALMLFAGLPQQGTFWTNVLPASLLAALGMALAYIPATMSGISGARPGDTGLASGLINTTYQVGSAVGLAVMVALAASVAPHGGTETKDLLHEFQTAFFGSAVTAFLGAAATLMFVRSSVSPSEVPVG